MQVKQLNRIIITGGSGFIGTNLVEYYRKNNWTIKNVDINPPVVQEHYEYWQKVDINDKTLLNEAVSKFEPDFIIHLAARTDLAGRTINDYGTNIQGVSNLIDSIEKCSSIKRVIVASSMLVCKSGYRPVDDSDYQPDTTYGESKVQTERLLRESIMKCEWALIRPTSIWGPYFKVPYRNYFDSIISKYYFHIGKKSCTKTYGYIGNSVYQINQVLISDKTLVDERVFYIGDYQPYNIEVWSNEIANELGYKIKRFPYILFKISAYFGDILKVFNIHFLMTTFRLKNMTTDNIIEYSLEKKVAPNLPFTRLEGIKETLKWIKK